MTAPDQSRIEKIFLEARPLDEAARAAYLDAECSGDAALRAQVVALLNAGVESESFFDDFAKRLGVSAMFSHGESAAGAEGAVGERIGAYTLTSPIASGGMGSVWRGERSDGRFEGQVAIKFVKILGGPAAARRFQLEGGYLARLAHPNIARLLDAGVSERGFPYLVIEFVDGIPIDAYAEKADLAVNARVALFLDVLAAVQHAHANLIVHRDLKPSNVLVTPAGVVKLLDFGVAKLLEGDESAAAGLTRDIGLALTPEYAAPEQILGQPVTTATDVYSLGLLLFRLLTGCQARKLEGTDPHAILRLATSPEPGRPSEVVGRDGATTSPGLRRQLRGDLDNIVGKATANEPARRYQTVVDFAADLRRFLAHEPVSAQPPTVTYRVSKFVRRHRGGVTAAILMALVLVGATGMTAWQAHAAKLGEQRATSVTKFVTSIFQGVDPGALGAQRPRTAVEILQQAEKRIDTELAGQPRVQEELRGIVARSYFSLYEAQRAHDTVAVALGQLTDETPLAMRRELERTMVDSLWLLGRFDEAEQHLQRVLATLDTSRPDIELIKARITQSAISYSRGDYDSSAQAAEDALTMAGNIRVTDAELMAQVHITYSKAVGMQRKDELSLQHSSEALRLALEAFDNDHDHPQVLEMEHSYAASLISLGRIDDALPYLERSVKAARNTYGDESLIAAHYSVRLGIAHMERGELRKAVELMKFGTETETRIGLRTSPSTSGRFRTLGRVQLFSRRPAEAVPAFERALEIIRPLERPPIQRRLEADLAFAIGASSGAIDAAIIELDKVIRAQDADEARHRTHLPDLYAGALLLWKNDARAAMVYLDRGVPLARAQTRKSELAEGLNSLGVARLALGDATGAAQAFREALELLEQNQVEATPALADTRVGLGCVALAGGDTAAALGHLDEAQKFWETFDPGNRSAGEAAYWRAEALARTGREAEARTAYDLAISNLSMSRLPADAGMVRDARRARSVLVAGAARVGA